MANCMAVVAGLVIMATLASAERPTQADQFGLAREMSASSARHELVLHNMAQESVTFQLGSDQVEVQAGQWGVLGPVEHDQVVVMVKTHSVKALKELHIDMASRRVDEGARSVVVTAMESWRLKSGKYLVFQVGNQPKVALSFKL